MERESFEDSEIARLMNEHFVCIKVDREERPDIDDIYMAATVAIHGSGGWPMTVFLTPEQEPFFAGTYFPRESTGAAIGFGALLTRVAQLWSKQREDLLAQADQLTRHLRAMAAPAPPAAIESSAIQRATEQLSQSFDGRFGGFGSAPKFPPCAALSLLLREYYCSGEPTALSMVCTTLDGMKNGGLYDQLSGGFSRYSTDDRWLVPHFEKMLYDNAQLATVYLEAYQVTGDPEYARIAEETLDYVVRDMQSPEGGYYCSTDADSEGVEGKFFVFTPDEIYRALEPRSAQLFCAYFNVTPVGNWEGRSVLNTPRTLSEVAVSLALRVDDATQLLAQARRDVLRLRQQRVPPQLDDKVLTSWNGLMLVAMSEGARVLGHDRYFDSAARAARFALGQLERPDGGLFRTWRNGKAHLDGYLEDYAFLADGLISLYESGGGANLSYDPHEYLAFAQTLAERLVVDFTASDGSFYATAHGHEALLVRSREGHDGALPSANAVAARVLLRLARHLSRDDLRVQAVQALDAYGAHIARSPRAFATSVCVMDLARANATELVFAGRRGDPLLSRLMAEAARFYMPNAVRAVAWEGGVGETPLTRAKGAAGGQAALYVCRDQRCDAPISEPSAIEASLLG
jgi:uncharacterized protein YyaL (SSP411 family)